MENIKLIFEAAGEPASDACVPYNVTTDRECVLWEVIKAILEHENGEEWGEIKLNEGRSIFEDYAFIEYKKGKILDTDISEEELDKKVKRITAYGGWSYMHYCIILEK